MNVLQEWLMVLAREVLWLQHAPRETQQAALIVAVCLVVLMVTRPRFTLLVLVAVLLLPVAVVVGMLVVVVKLALFSKSPQRAGRRG